MRLKKDFAGHELMVMVGANARVGTTVSEAIGPNECEKENDTGVFMRIYLESVGLLAANTFADAGWTWRAAQGKTTRTYFIMLEQHGSGVTDIIVVDSSLDLNLFEWPDHRALVADFTFAAKKDEGGSKKNKCGS